MALSKRIRFEVFKRDSFKCQYCGAAAPEVLLQVDHVKPVAEGGEDDILNLVTACAPCNSGKGPRELSDGSAVEKQRAQLEELQERREQLEMMLDWRRGLASLKDAQLEEASRSWTELTGGYALAESGHDKLRRWIRRQGLHRVLDAMEEAAESYLKRAPDGQFTRDSVETAFTMVPRIISVSNITERKPYWRDIVLIRGILRRRLGWIDQVVAIRVLERAVLLRYEIDDLRTMAMDAKSWNRWFEEMDRMIVAAEEPKP